MQQLRKILAASGMAALAALGCATAQRAQQHARMQQHPTWQKIDSLNGLGQYASALGLTEKLLTEARAKDDWRTEFRAWMYKGRFLQGTGTDGKDVIKAMEARADSAGTPLGQLLHSVIADQWWDLYEEERWEVLGRTALAEPSDDPDTWDQAAFMRKVIAEYSASLEPVDALAAIPTGELGVLLEPANADLRLRPSLFDLLAHRAIDMFRNSETRLAGHADHFRMDDPRLFSPAAAFAAADLTHADTTAWHWQCLRLYQRLTALHLHDAAPFARTGVELGRLAFVRGKSTLPEKDSLYMAALHALRGATTLPEARAEVDMAIAQAHADRADGFQRLAPDSAWKWEKKAAADLCREVIAEAAGPFAVKKAKALLARLEQPALHLEAEEAVVPDQAFKVALTFTNVKRAWLRVVKDDRGAGQVRRYRDADEWKRLLALKPLRTWDLALPDDGGLNTHLTELPVEALPLGEYRIIVSASENFAAGPTAMAALQVTQLAVAQRSDDQGRHTVLVMDRQSGAPVQGAKAQLFFISWQRGGQRTELVGTALTDADGMAQLAAPKQDNGRHHWTVTQGADRLDTPEQYYYRNRGDAGQEDTLRTFLFTDRAIYRPGQPVLFKGIVAVKRGGTTVVKPRYATTVKFMDVNRQPIDSLQVTTDDFGAFHGQFTAPSGTLTGGMVLQEAHGSRGIQVEEYKRPAFEVLFPPNDTATAAAAPKLGAMATVHGLARSYAGVPLDGATVQWRVTRSARMPWWCGDFWRSFIPWGTPTEVASGTAQTDGAGRFSISFLAQADRAIPRQADPAFGFRIEASATDVNGETQSGSTAISVGYRSFDIVLQAGEGIDRSANDSLVLAVQDLDGHALDVPMDVRITRLQAPQAPLRERLWERPDVRVIDQEQHRQFFMQDVYADEADPLNWPREAVVLERKGWRAKGKPLALARIAGWDVGEYLIEASATGTDGRTVAVQKAVSVFDPAVQHTGFTNEPFHVEAVKAAAEPGEKARLLVSSALPRAHVLMEVERQGIIAVRRWFTLERGQQLVELPVQEADRGGFTVHFACVERGRSHQLGSYVNVPWSNKELQVEWMSFRDKLLPGQAEEWRLKISGPKGSKVAAQLLAGMYDASLDAFVPHAWDLSVWPSRYAQLAWERIAPFGLARSEQLWDGGGLPDDTAHVHPALRLFGFDGGSHAPGYRGGRVMMMANGAPAPPVEEAQAEAEDSAVLKDARGRDTTGKDAVPEADVPQPSTRSDFRETAFFFPDLLTDRDGNVVLKFTMPDALTRWKFLGLAHTTDLKTARVTREVITQKPLMVVPNLPRFLREGDTITVSAKVNVVDAAPKASSGSREADPGAMAGTATLELFDPFTGKPVDAAFGMEDGARPFTAAQGASASVQWTLSVPEGMGAVAVRISAKAGAFTDAEQHPLPILTDRVLVTESLPLPISKAGTASFTLEKLMHGTSTTLRHQHLKLEFTPNPAWYAVQALPYLMEYPHLCSEQVFSRLYANSLAGHIVDQRPALKEVFAKWGAKGPGNEEAFLSALEENPELKNVVLAETPWVLDAGHERERKQRIGLLFGMQRMAGERARALKQLRDAQLGSGAWPWFSGMQPSRWATRQIVAGFGHLEQLGAADLRPDGQTQAMLKQAVQWLDGEVEADYRRLRKDHSEAERKQYTPGHGTVQYLYARSFFRRWAVDGATATAVNFYQQRLAATWLNFGLQEQAMIALALHRMGDKATAQLIMKSLGERATRSEELGMYWKNFRAGYFWWEFPAETDALLIEAFHEVARDQAAVNALRLHLLKLKQTTDWKTTTATADACYALLLTGDDRLADAGAPQITVGGQAVVPDQQEAGTGYFTKSWSAGEINPAMGQVSVTTTADRAAWGALYWQYFEQMDKVTAAESPFSIRKQVLLKESGTDGPKLVALDKARALRPGDKLTVRIELRADRAMDHVHLKDLRASGLEPTETLSGYRFQGGLGWYQSTRDAATDFFFDQVPAGTYVLEYDLRVAQSGDFSNGITTVQCMYAPEFAGHSEGVRIRVGR